MLELEPEDRVLPELLKRRVERSGDRPFASFEGIERTYAETLATASRLAGSLAAAGITRGDRVAVMAENRIEVLDIFVACAWLGAIFVPINTAYRGSQLGHVLRDAQPRAFVLEPRYLPQLDNVESPPDIDRLWILDGELPSGAAGRAMTLLPTRGDPVEAAAVRPGDTLAILYTSGTTGPAKGVCCPHAQFYWWGVNTGNALALGEADTLYTCLPLFHTNALNAFVQALVSGSRYVLGPRFSASRFWERVSAADATVTYLLGAMVSILAARQPSPSELRQRIRIALAPATPVELHATFKERFGISIVEGHGMTETNFVIGPRDGVQQTGTMGRVMPGFEARVVDDDDVELPDGAPGELVVRASEPFAFATGYWRMPEQTVASWRNLWFHTGDRVVRGEDEYFRFVDRIKDMIRRRGENISAWEVEQVLLGHPDVAAAAVIPVPSELGEDDVMACVVPRQDAILEPPSLMAHCEPRLAYFAIPRYVEIMAELPMTENGKVQKFALRTRGVTPSTWDRDEAGYALER